jgi:two-component system response regulator HydG
MSESTSRVRILAVSTQTTDVLSLARIFDHSTWSFDSATSLTAALRFLAKNSVEVVLCDRSLPDGTWRDLLNSVTMLEHPPQLIVTAHDADDRLWAEVLNLGAYDVLIKPYQPKEVFRTVGNAWRQCTELRRVQNGDLAIPKLAAAVERRDQQSVAAAGRVAV